MNVFSTLLMNFIDCCHIYHKKLSITATLGKFLFHYSSNLAQSEEDECVHYSASEPLAAWSEAEPRAPSCLCLFTGASKSKMCLISEAVKVRLGMDQVSLIHPILPEQPLLTGYQSMYPPTEHC